MGAWLEELKEPVGREMSQMQDLQLSDLDLRGQLTRHIAEFGHAPTNEQLAATMQLPVSEIEASLRRLHDAHALLLHPHTCAPWVVHPFALSPGACWVHAADEGWWANCLYCGMGIAAALETDADIHTRYGGEDEPVVVAIRNGRVMQPDLIFHLATPVRHWWDNVIHACASFQPFRDDQVIDGWCSRHGFERGAVLPLSRLWPFAVEWYGSYLSKPWRKRSPEEIADLFLRHGLVGEFWNIR
jgi:hypothetical protein